MGVLANEPFNLWMEALSSKVIWVGLLKFISPLSKYANFWIFTWLFTTNPSGLLKVIFWNSQLPFINCLTVPFNMKLLFDFKTTFEDFSFSIISPLKILLLLKINSLFDGCLPFIYSAIFLCFFNIIRFLKQLHSCACCSLF